MDVSELLISIMAELNLRNVPRSFQVGLELLKLSDELPAIGFYSPSAFGNYGPPERECEMAFSSVVSNVGFATLLCRCPRDGEIGSSLPSIAHTSSLHC